jgi:hypothetical protein
VAGGPGSGQAEVEKGVEEHQDGLVLEVQEEVQEVGLFAQRSQLTNRGPRQKDRGTLYKLG